ncbi:hypothetical protein ABFS82_02G066600 [Erythranthe guttata]
MEDKEARQQSKFFLSLYFRIKELFFAPVIKSSMENKETSTESSMENKETSTESWSPLSDGIVTKSPTLDDQHINDVLYGVGGIRRRRLPVFEEICPSATQKHTHPRGYVWVDDEQIKPSP